MTYDPNHLRNAATLLSSRNLHDAASVLRAEADAIQKKKIEDELHLKIGSHFRDLVKTRLGWTFNAVRNEDIIAFGAAAKDSVNAHCKPVTKADIFNTAYKGGIGLQ